MAKPESSCSSVCFGSEADLISGRYRKGQLQIGVQEARKRRPELSDDALLELGKAVHEKRCEAFGLGS